MNYQIKKPGEYIMTDQTSNDKIIARIKKMMALAKDAGASQGERDNAMRMAYNTLAKYNLDESDLTEEEAREILGFMGPSGPWCRRVANSVAGLFFCNYYSQRTGKKLTHKFVGKNANALTAQLMTEYVIKSIEGEAGKIARKEKFDSTWKTNFAKGAASIIYDRCLELREKQSEELVASTGTGMVLASLYKRERDANSGYLASIGIKLRKRASTEQGAGGGGFSAGKEFGAGISLHGQVGGKASGQLRIGA